MALLLSGVGAVLGRHVSARPWIIGHQRSGAVQVVEVGPIRAVVLGECLVEVDRLETAARGGIDPLMRLPGSFHALITGRHGMIAAGDVAGLRRLFTARPDGVALVASHADVLRRLIDAPVNRVWLAAKLASPEPPSVLRDTYSPFTGVTPVPVGHRVEITPTVFRLSRWWTPPMPTHPITVGAAALREALTQAVTGRLRQADGPVSVQLSGGLDSTVLACLAQSARPLLITTAGRSLIDDDLGWARCAARLLEGSTHQVIPADEAPLFFTGLDMPQQGLDEPAPFAAAGARLRHTGALLAEHGTMRHFNGQGGDEVLLATLAYLRPAIRAAPRMGWRHLRGHAALKNIPLRTFAWQVLSDRAPFPLWLRRAADTLRSQDLTAVAATGWEAPPLLPPWASHEAADLVAAAILAAEPEPAADDRVTHAALVRIRASAWRAGLYRDALQAAGLPTAMPFFDRRVVEACLSVRPWERTDPWTPKPLLRAAFHDAVPQHLLSRRTKGAYNTDIHHGWTTHRTQLLELLGRPLLAEHGLVDAVRLRAALSAFGRSGLTPAWITDLIAVETWLRDLAPPFTLQEAQHATVAADPTRPLSDRARPHGDDRAR